MDRVIGPQMDRVLSLSTLSRGKVTSRSGSQLKGGYLCDISIMLPDGTYGPILVDVPIMARSALDARPPSVGDQVIVAFMEGDPSAPVVMGTLLASSDDVPTFTPGECVSEYPLPRGGASRKLIRFEGKAPGEELAIEMGDDSVSLTTSLFILKKANTTIEIDNKGNLTLDVQGDLKISVKGNIKISSQDYSIAAKGDLGIKTNSKASFSGSGGVEVTSDANVKVKGARIDLN